MEHSSKTAIIVHNNTSNFATLTSKMYAVKRGYERLINHTLRGVNSITIVTYCPLDTSTVAIHWKCTVHFFPYACLGISYMSFINPHKKIYSSQHHQNHYSKTKQWQISKPIWKIPLITEDKQKAILSHRNILLQDDWKAPVATGVPL